MTLRDPFPRGMESHKSQAWHQSWFELHQRGKAIGQVAHSQLHLHNCDLMQRLFRKRPFLAVEGAELTISDVEERVSHNHAGRGPLIERMIAIKHAGLGYAPGWAVQVKARD